jgi:hypothetical protein
MSWQVRLVVKREHFTLKSGNVSGIVVSGGKAVASIRDNGWGQRGVYVTAKGKDLAAIFRVLDSSVCRSLLATAARVDSR